MLVSPVCDTPMLDGEKTAPIDGAETPDSDGTTEVPLDETGSVVVKFKTPPSELTQVKVTPPDETEPGDKITVTVEYIDEDDNPITKVSLAFLKKFFQSNCYQLFFCFYICCRPSPLLCIILYCETSI